MKTQNEIKGEFEKLEKIKSVLNESTYYFIDGHYGFKGNTKDPKIVYAMGFVNGAWYAFQERQKIILMQECGATEIKMILDDVEYDDTTKINKIKELLK